MNLGTMSQTVYRRSVRGQLSEADRQGDPAPAIDEFCFGIAEPEGRELSSSCLLCGNEKDLCVFAIAQAVNHLASRGAAPRGVTIELALPEFAYESRVKAMVGRAAEAAACQGLAVYGAHASCFPGIATTIVSVTALGDRRDEKQNGCVKADQDLLMIKWTGLEGTLRAKRACEDVLAARFSADYVGKIEAFMGELFSVREMEAAAAKGVSAMQPVAEGGVLAALWNLAERAGVGLSVDLRKIPVRQETIEVCECFHLNPYQLMGGSAVLLAADNGEELADALKEMNIPAAVIGRTTAGNDRVLYSGAEMRYLDRPAPEELFRVLADVKDPEDGE